MLRHLLILFSFLTGIHISQAQKVLVNVFMESKTTRPLSDTIYFDPDKPLSWSDFKGVPDNHHSGGAVTASGYAFDADIKIENKVIYLNIGVYTFFSKKGSWKKPSINSAYHLLHEQHHFDISRVSAEKFIWSVAKAKFTKDNYEQLISSLFDQSYDECNKLQEKYDTETQHSINRDEQFKWNERIAGMVEKVRRGGKF